MVRPLTRRDRTLNLKMLRELHEGLDMTPEFERLQQELYSMSESEPSSKVYPPVMRDLSSLFHLIVKEGILSILEFGSGWTTVVMAAALDINRTQLGNSLEIRHPNPFMVTSVDASEHFARIAMSRVKQAGLEENVVSVVSDVAMTMHGGQVSHQFTSLPPVTADLILLDGPDPGQVTGDVNGYHVRFGDAGRTYGLPMASDILSFENFIWPGSYIVVDGRGANARFLHQNLRRQWDYCYSEFLDQHFFRLDEEPWGRESRLLMNLRSHQSLQMVVTGLEKCAMHL